MRQDHFINVSLSIKLISVVMALIISDNHMMRSIIYQPVKPFITLKYDPGGILSSERWNPENTNSDMFLQNE